MINSIIDGSVQLFLGVGYYFMYLIAAIPFIFLGIDFFYAYGSCFADLPKYEYFLLTSEFCKK